MMTVASASPSAPSRRRARASRRGWLILWAWLGALALVRAGSLEERDPYWQIRAGIENLEGQPLVRPDSWSWAPVDNPFVQTSPWWNDLLGLAWRGGEFLGLFLLTLVSLLLYLGTVVALGRRLGARPLPMLGGLVVVLLVALPMLSPRATLAAQTLFLLGLLVADRWAHRSPRPAAVVDGTSVFAASFVLAWVGSWVHLSWMLLAPASALAWTVLWWSRAAVAGGRRWLLSVASVLGFGLGALAGPYGSSALEVSQRVQAACEGVISEWLGMFTSGLAARWVPAGLLAIVGFGLAAVWVARRWRSRLADPRVGLVAALCVLGLPAALGAFQAIRFIGVALLALAPVAALAATVLADSVRRRAADVEPRGVFRNPRIRFWSQGRPWATVLTIVVVLVAPLALLMASTLARPTESLPAVAALPRDCRLFSDPASAAPVLLLRPDVKVWIDGRADYYGRARNIEAIRVLSGDSVDVPAIEGATCVVLDLQDEIDPSDLAASLDSSPRWTRILDDGRMPVWARTS